MKDWRAAVRRHLRGARLDGAREIEIVEEFAQHLEERYHALKARGLDDEAAERAALVELGDPNALAVELERSDRTGRTAPTAGASASGSWLYDLWSDLRFAARTFRGNPGFTVTAVLCLALGIGATSTVFGVADAIFFRAPPGVGNPSGLVRPYLSAQSARFNNAAALAVLPYPLFDQIRAQSRRLDGIAGSRLFPVSFGLGLNARPADALLVTGDYFSVLQVQPALGRFFLANERSPVAVVTYAYWRGELHGDPSAVGSSFAVNGHSLTIIGVAPEGFVGIDGFPSASIRANVGPVGAWVPYALADELGLPSGPPRLLLSGIARLAPGVTLPEARAELESIMLRTLRDGLGAEVEGHLELGPILHARGPYPGESADITRWVALAAALVLAMACVNTASLLLNRAVVRRREIAIRLSMGARRSRLVRQLLAESALLAIIGTALGLVLLAGGRL
jgi:putative ABC transport system permease protein